MRKFCPKCKTDYPETANYCRICGLELTKEGNRCSENRGALCRTLTFRDDDVYCECCGSLTTYAAERMRHSAATPQIKTIPVY
jgi:predicted amidophosphoribosyltransferase